LDLPEWPNREDEDCYINEGTLYLESGMFFGSGDWKDLQIQ
jgi:hypothetical protein